ncbi:MAG: sugar ABC transporter ATP-binding protein, partial [Verrucomicrobiota bacterium]
PTSSLSHGETEALFALMKRLRDGGKTIVFISHRLAEVREISDRVIVLRDGENSGELAREDINHEKMVKLMVGRDLDLHRRRDGGERGESALTVSKLRTMAFPSEKVDFELRSGEIVGMAGLVGAGRTELSRAIFGVDKKLEGEVRVNGEEVRLRSPRDAMRAGIAYVPEDRKAHGLIVSLSIRDNVALPSLNRHNTAGWVSDDKLDALAERNRKELSVRSESIKKPVVQLSGGNQQKVAIGKWIARDPKVFLLDEPTRGVDVGSKDEIYHEIEKLAAGGAAVLFISSELEELLRVSDRILVMHEGRITGEVSGDEMTEENIMTLATGSTESLAA